MAVVDGFTAAADAAHVTRARASKALAVHGCREFVLCVLELQNLSA
jgi:hypothetical protein